MKIIQEFTLDRPSDQVWAFFHDVPAVASCLPGAEYLGTKPDGSLSGKMSMKVGPFQAAFEGAATVEYDEEARRAKMEGKGVDKKGASRGKMTMDCAIAEVDGGTKVSVDADVQLSGTIAQFGRTGIIQEIASVLIGDFVANVEQALPAASPVAAAEAPLAAERKGIYDVCETGVSPRASTGAVAPKAKPISGARLVWLSLRGWFRSLLRRSA
ncbi:MAG: hypothetical protein DI556_15395 [Rhodovulum sulfidophilum]|uniref:Carbon monoxide dehydrogenase n=1 Tax=Rhodovulum sulfidophilum TaxID=35806 RepID=A0A2W5Q0A7_RHOSU|nr:MAG: hypothetical protein DI556_15395 [Rhodovulum sulfidophilum]